MLDAPGQPAEALRDNLREIELVNRFLGGRSLTLRALQDVLASGPQLSHLTVLDVAAGSGDIPAAIAGWAGKLGVPALIVASDLSGEVLSLSAQHSGLQRVVADGRHLPFPNKSVDVATCSLVLHHLVPDDAVRLLREMARVSSRGVVVNDLVRCRSGYLGALALSRLTRNPLTRHDAPLSVRRAYTRPEIDALLATAGLSAINTHSFFGYRLAVAARSRE